MNKLILKVIAGLILSLTATPYVMAADTDDQSDIAFVEGVVHVYCIAPENTNNDVFLEAFPKLIINIQAHADEGRVVRAHYLKELTHGIFIVVGGETREEAVVNAKQLLDENKAILNASVKAAGVESDDSLGNDTCRVMEVGPVAVLPKK